jgi:hypothetical protein
MKKRNRRHLRKPKTRRKKRDAALALTYHPFSGVDPAIMNEVLTRLAAKSAEDFPSLMDSLLTLLRNKNPLQILATLAAYGLQVGVSDEGIDGKPLASGISQHHVELVQALALSIPLTEWGTHPAIPPDIQHVIEEAAKLTEAFHQRRFKAVEHERDLQARTVLGLQERLRLHTQVVRNWGYFSHVVEISEELYAPLDDRFREALGFGTIDLIKVARCLIKLQENRMSERFRRLQRIFRERKVAPLIRNYYKQTPGIEGDPEELIKSLPKHVTRDEVASHLFGHADLRLAELLTFSPDEIAATVGLPSDLVGAVLEALSLAPDDLQAEDKEHFFLGNPVWHSPVIFLGKVFFCALPQAIFSHIHEIMRSLADKANLRTEIEDRRAAFLEAKVENLLTSAFPKAKLRHGVKWRDGETVYETDHIVAIDKTIIIVEDKSAALTAPALRGAPHRVKRHVQELIGDPSEQSARLEAIIWKSKNGDADAIASLSVFDIDFPGVETVVRLSITLDDFSILASAERDLKEANWIPKSASLAATTSVADLRCLIDILEHPAFLVHYLMERERIQKTMEIFADEMDFLGFYLQTGFNVGSLEKQQIVLALTGMSRPIDRYYESRDAGVILEKPTPKIRPYLGNLIRRMEIRAFPGWLGAAIDLLRSISPNEQKRLDRMFEKLRRNVEKNWHDPKHECSIIIIPPEMREATVVFFAYPEKLSDRRKESAEELVARAMDESGRSRCVLIGRNIDRWDEPYSFVLIADGRRKGNDDNK